MDKTIEIVKTLDQLIERAKKLTTKDRKALKKGTFCGPGRSFPVPDCQHVATAKAFLNRSNFSKATKQRIASCINGKAKSLGCGKGKPAKAKGGLEDLLMNDPIFNDTKILVEQSLKSPGMNLDWEEKTCCDEKE